MKKLVNILFVFVMCFVLVGCGKSDDTKKKEVEKNDAELEAAMMKTVTVAKTIMNDYATTDKDLPIGVEQDVTLLDLEERPQAGTYIVMLEESNPIVTVHGLIFDNYICDYEITMGARCRKMN